MSRKGLGKERSDGEQSELPRAMNIILAPTAFVIHLASRIMQLATLAARWLPSLLFHSHLGDPQDDPTQDIGDHAGDWSLVVNFNQNDCRVVGHLANDGTTDAANAGEVLTHKLGVYCAALPVPGPNQGFRVVPLVRERSVVVLVSSIEYVALHLAPDIGGPVGKRTRRYLLNSPVGILDLDHRVESVAQSSGKEKHLSESLPLLPTKDNFKELGLNLGVESVGAVGAMEIGQIMLPPTPHVYSLRSVHLNERKFRAHHEGAWWIVTLNLRLEHQELLGAYEGLAHGLRPVAADSVPSAVHHEHPDIAVLVVA